MMGAEGSSPVKSTSVNGKFICFQMCCQLGLKIKNLSVVLKLPSFPIARGQGNISEILETIKNECLKFRYGLNVNPKFQNISQHAPVALRCVACRAVCDVVAQSNARRGR
jgi:hypothetical protein